MVLEGYDHDIGGPYEDDEQYCALSRPVSCQPRPSMGIIWALCGAQLQLSLTQLGLSLVLILVPQAPTHSPTKTIEQASKQENLQVS